MARADKFAALVDDLIKEGKFRAEDRDAAIKLAETNPEIADGFLRQSDYSRFMADNQEKIKSAEAWDGWSKRNLDTYNKIREEYPRLQQVDTEFKTLKEKYDAILSGKDTDMNQEQLTAAVAAELEKRGVKNPTDDQIKSMVSTVVGSLVDDKAKALENQFVNQTLPSHLAFIADVMEVAGDYRTEFGEKIDRKSFIQFCAQGGFDTTDKAYEKFVEGKRAEVKHKKELEEVSERVRKETRDQLMNQNLPGSTAPAMGPFEPGPLQTYIRTSATPPPATSGAQPGGSLGDGSAAAVAAAELRAEGK